MKSAFLTVDLFDTRAVRSCRSGPILWGNIPAALSRIIPNPMFGFCKSRCKLKKIKLEKVYLNLKNHLIFACFPHSPFPKRFQPNSVQTELRKLHQSDGNFVLLHHQSVTKLTMEKFTMHLKIYECTVTFLIIYL